jgi:hypothetical protein
MSERRLTVAQARRVVELLEQCKDAVKGGDDEAAEQAADDASLVACHSSTRLYGAIADIGDALNPDDADVGYCTSCGEACPNCGPDTIKSPKEAVEAAIEAATAELEAAERAAYIPRKAVIP